MNFKKHWLSILILFLVFLTSLFIQKPICFSGYNFEAQQTVSDYLRSQDIYDPEERIKDRIIISDSDIYLGSGYLYALGKNPADYNFQHPPLIKYLYGYSLRFFNNPYVLQFIFVLSLILLTYFLAYKVSKSYKVAILASLLIIFDPLTFDSFNNIYLDLGQTVFGLSFVLVFITAFKKTPGVSPWDELNADMSSSLTGNPVRENGEDVIFYPRKWFLSGILFGLLLAAKFWSVSLFIFLLLLAYRIFVAKDVRLGVVLKTILTALIVYLAVYSAFFINGGNLFEFARLQFKMVKFMVEHNSISAFGQQFNLFLTGFYSDWWKNGSIARSNVWSVLWPVSLIAIFIGTFYKKLRPKVLFLFIIIIGFFVATLKGAPFSRYIIFITPYLYIALSMVVVHFLSARKKKGVSVEKHFDKVASSYDSGKEKYSYYYSNLKKLLLGLIGKNKDVFEFGCGTGDLLASLNPKNGIGYDISAEMIKIAKKKHGKNKNLFFTHSPYTIHYSPFTVHSSLNFVFMSDVIEHLDHPEETFKMVSKLMGKNTKFIITMANPIWEPFLMLAEKLKLKMPEGKHDRIKYKDLRIMLKKTGMKIARHDYKLLVPIKIPFITNFANKYLEKPLKKLCFIEFFVVQKSTPLSTL